MKDFFYNGRTVPVVNGNMLDSLEGAGDSDSLSALEDSLKEAEDNGKKYILGFRHDGLLWRIVACRDFSDVKRGDIGGMVEYESNLSQERDCWLYDDSVSCSSPMTEVFDNAKLKGNAYVCNGAKVFGRAVVEDFASVSENAKVYGDAWLHEHARMWDRSRAFGHAEISGNAIVGGDVVVCDNAIVTDDAYLEGYLKVCENARVLMKFTMTEGDEVISDYRFV